MNGKFSATCFMAAAIFATGVAYIHLTVKRAAPAPFAVLALTKHPHAQHVAITPLRDDAVGGATRISLMDWEFFNSPVLISSTSSSSPIAGDVIRL